MIHTTRTCTRRQFLRTGFWSFRMEFTHHVALEYEAHPETPMPGVMESIAYIRGVLAALD